MRPRILFIGGTPRGLELIKLLVGLGEDVVYACIMQEDDHEVIKVSPAIKEVCEKNNIPAKVCKRISLDDMPQIMEPRPDAAFVCGWRTIIPSALYNALPVGCMAAHDSLLPKYRGFAPLNWAIINGEKQCGVTLFRIGEGVVDSGKIAGQKSVDIGTEEAAADVYPRIIDATVELYKEFLSALRTDSLTLRDQDEKLATYTCKRVPGDGEIDWTKSAHDVFNLIRALSPPYPCARTLCKGDTILITRASLPHRQLNYAGNIPGRVVSIGGDGVSVLCGEGQILVQDIITPTGEPVEAKQFLTSLTITLGR